MSLTDQSLVPKHGCSVLLRSDALVAAAHFPVLTPDDKVYYEGANRCPKTIPNSSSHSKRDFLSAPVARYLSQVNLWFNLTAFSVLRVHIFAGCRDLHASGPK